MVKTLRDLRKQRRRDAVDETTRARASAASERADRLEFEPMPMLICSDHHLGEHGKDLNRIEYVKRVHDKDLCAWLEHYAQHRIDGRPWRLVINGDFVDFLAVTFMPGAAQAETPFELDEHEEQWGLDNTAERVVWKLEHIADRHKVMLTYLGDFLARGNVLDMLYGNHDVEFYWPQVQQRFVDLIVEVYFGGEHIEGVTPDEIRSRVRFHEWFLYIPGRVYIEHGNQYDDFCSFDHVLRPVMVYDQHRIAMPVAHNIIRYFVNQYSGFRSHGKDNWTLLDYVGWFRSQGWQNGLRILFLYGNLFSKVWGYARATQLTVVPQDRREAHERLLVSEARRYGMAPEVIREINDERNRPLETHLGAIIQVTALDKYLVGLGLGAIFLFVLGSGAVIDTLSGFDDALITSSGFRLLTLLVAGVAGVFLWRASGWLTAKFAGRRLSTSVAPKLDRAASNLARLLDVPHVVMGHTHRPLQRVVSRSPEVTYTNTGAWIPAARREDDQLTYAIYDWEGEQLSLLEWDTRELEPKPFVPRSTERPGWRERNSALEQVERAELLDALERFGSPADTGDDVPATDGGAEETSVDAR